MRIFFLAAVLFIAANVDANAQAVSSKIMDANISWSQSGNQYTGQLNVYLTDTVGIAGLAIGLGTVVDSTDLHAAQYTIANSGTFYGTGTIDANYVLRVPIGTYAYHEEYHAKVTVVLDNATSNDIAIRSSN